MALALFLVACGGGNLDEPSGDNDHDSQLHDFAAEYEHEFGHVGGGLVLGLVNDHELTEHGVVYLDNIDDTLNVQFANLTETNSEYILKLFYDYEEVPFTVNGEGAFVSSHVFVVDSIESVVIPVNLDSGLRFDDSHFLTVAVLTAPNSHAVDLDLMSNSYGMTITFELTNRNGSRQINESPIAQEPMSFLQLQYQGLMLNLDFDASDNVSTMFPPKEIRVSSGETVRLAYRTGNYEYGDDVLFIVLVDWQQQVINNKPFIHTINKPGFISLGVIEFTAPLEKGKYEITGFVVTSPFELRGGDNFWINDTCHRFTLIVE
jgi:hypothetical protein